MKQNLFNISTDHVELMNEIYEVEGVLTPELEERLIINEKNRDVKCVAYLEVIRKSEAWNTIVDEEIKRLQASKKRTNTLINHLKDRLVGAINLFGDFTAGTVQFGTRKSSSLTIVDFDKIPMDYKTKNVTITADKKAIKEAIKQGNDVPGAELQENQSLKIK